MFTKGPLLSYNSLKIKHFQHQLASRPNQGVGRGTFLCQKGWFHNL